MKFNLNSEWRKIVTEELDKNYLSDLEKTILSEYENNIVYPAFDNIFRTYNETPLEGIKVVIIGQDPYHTPNLANGLAFSSDIKIPKSLKNIFKEIENEYSLDEITDPDLSRWSKQGVFLLNSTLTVRKGVPDSHKKIGWDILTDATIKSISKKKQNIVYLLWGNNAMKKINLINTENNLILNSTHPSPFSANKGFFGNNHFRKCNNFLNSKGIKEINWS